MRRVAQPLLPTLDCLFDPAKIGIRGHALGRGQVYPPSGAAVLRTRSRALHRGVTF